MATVYHRDATDLILYAFPLSEDLANWATARVLLAETEEGSTWYTAQLDDDVADWAIFTGEDAPASFSESGDRSISLVDPQPLATQDPQPGSAVNTLTSIQAEKIVACMPLDDEGLSADVTARDASWRQTPGTYGPGGDYISLVDGIEGYATEFGGTDALVNLDTDITYEKQDAHSWFMRFKLNSLVTANVGGWAGSLTSKLMSVLQVINGQWYVLVRNLSNVLVINDYLGPADTEWHTVACSMTTGGEAIFYMDGEEVARGQDALGTLWGFGYLHAGGLQRDTAELFCDMKAQHLTGWITPLSATDVQHAHQMAFPEVGDVDLSQETLLAITGIVQGIVDEIDCGGGSGPDPGGPVVVVDGMARATVELVRGDDHLGANAIEFKDPGDWPAMDENTLIKVGLVGADGSYEYETASYSGPVQEGDTGAILWELSREETALLRSWYTLDVQAEISGQIYTLVRGTLVADATTTDIPENQPLLPGWLG